MDEEEFLERAGDIVLTNQWDEVGTLEGNEARAKYSQKERQKIPLEDFGDPSRRAFPIVDAEDVIHAAERLGEAGGSKAAIKKRVIAIAKRKGFPLPQTWQEKGESRGVDMDGVERVNPLWLPIVRFDETNWTVTGQATVEDEDSYGTMFDYDAGKRAFGAWRGNVREMHDSKKAVGRAIDVAYDDVAKSIFVTTKISRGAKDTWEKVKDGTLTGYSVGALASKDDWTTVERNGKAVPLLKNYRLAELSLVDHPSTPGCDIQIVRADGFGADGVLMDDEEVEEVTRVAEPTTTRAGAKVSHATQSDLHGIRNTALMQAQTTMGICACEECIQGASALDPDGDGDIDIMDSTNYLDNGQYRTLEPMITRALQPTLKRVNGVLASFIQQANQVSQSPSPVNVDLAPIERRLAKIEENATAVTSLEALTRALDAKLVEIRNVTERIANQPIGGGPIANVAAMDKIIATQGIPINQQNEMALLARKAQSGNITEDERVALAAQMIKLERGI